MLHNQIWLSDIGPFIIYMTHGVGLLNPKQCFQKELLWVRNIYTSNTSNVTSNTTTSTATANNKKKEEEGE